VAVALCGCAIAYGLTYRFAVMPAAMVSGLGAEVFPRLVIGVREGCRYAGREYTVTLEGESRATATMQALGVRNRG